MKRMMKILSLVTMIVTTVIITSCKPEPAVEPQKHYNVEYVLGITANEYTVYNNCENAREMLVVFYNWCNEKESHQKYENINEKKLYEILTGNYISEKKSNELINDLKNKGLTTLYDAPYTKDDIQYYDVYLLSVAK